MLTKDKVHQHHHSHTCSHHSAPPSQETTVQSESSGTTVISLGILASVIGLVSYFGRPEDQDAAEEDFKEHVNGEPEPCLLTSSSIVPEKTKTRYYAPTNEPTYSDKEVHTTQLVDEVITPNGKIYKYDSQCGVGGCQIYKLDEEATNIELERRKPTPPKSVLVERCLSPRQEDCRDGSYIGPDQPYLENPIYFKWYGSDPSKNITICISKSKKSSLMIDKPSLYINYPVKSERYCDAGYFYNLDELIGKLKNKEVAEQIYKNLPDSYRALLFRFQQT